MMPGAPLGKGHEGRISAVAQALSAPLSQATIARLSAWFDLLCVWNAKIDLTAARSPDELADLLLADALVLARHEPAGGAVVDVGAGAGAPGLALYLLRPDLRVTLVEPMQKRVAFLRTVAGQVGASGEGGSLRVVRARGEDLAEQGLRFDGAAARATFSPDEWLALAPRLLVPSGAAWVLLAREDPPAVTAGWEVSVDEAYVWPLTRAKRRAVRYKRVV
jgi:16S rRNA (guanine527-N7)-methyltransferase